MTAVTGAVADVASGDEICVIADGLAPQTCWTIEATIRDTSVRDGALAVVTEPDLDCVRALVVRGGRLGLLGWSWRGGQALWSDVRTRAPWSPVPGEWAHVAATVDATGDLMLYADGRPLKAFAVRGLFPGSHPQQRLLVGASVRFANELIPAWRGQVRDLAQRDRALTPTEVEQRARAVLNLPEPVPPPTPAQRPPDPVACEHPAHAGFWRRDRGRLRCLRCEPPRGCPHDQHQIHWRPIGSDMRFRADDWWHLTCAFCETTARNGGPIHDPGETA